MSQIQITSNTVGTFVDSVAGTARTPGAVAGRLIEEVVELGLAAGMTSSAILGHVMDALHNQALKASATQGVTIFPSQLKSEAGESPEESADVSLVLKDFCYVSKIDLQAEEAKKWAVFKTKSFRVSATGTLYATKPHIKTG